MLSLKRKKFQLNTHGRCLPLGDQTKVMGVLNLTPDSFSRDGRLGRFKNDPKANTAYALKMIADGADIIDIGGESTRPNAPRVAVDEEIVRIIPTLQCLRKKTQAFLSVDTTKLEVAQRAFDAGADIINHVRGTQISKSFLKWLAQSDVLLVLMHSRGTPRNMQRLIQYKNLIPDILREIIISLEKCLDSGMNLDRILIDPGIGFAKTAEQNFELLNQLHRFAAINRPLLIGTSRKSFIGKVTSNNVQNRLWGTAASVTAAICQGAHIIRVHDVKAMKQVALVADAIIKPSIAQTL